METFFALLAICAGNSPVPGEFPAQRPVTRSFDVFFDLRPNKRLSKQWWGCWFKTLSIPLWRHCSVYGTHTWRVVNIYLSIHYADGRFTVRSCEVSKPWVSVLYFSNRSEIWQAPQQQRCRDACQISERYDHYNIKSHGFENSPDFAARHLTAQWIEVQNTQIRLTSRVSYIAFFGCCHVGKEIKLNLPILAFCHI